MLLLLVSAAFAVGPLQNGGFETGDFSSWTSWGDGTIVVNEGFEGTHAAQMSLDPGIDGFQESGLYQDVLGAVVGEHLRLSMMARALPSDPMTGTGVLILDWEVYGPDFSDFGVVEVALASDGSWSEGTIDFVFPEGATDVRYVLLLDGETLGTSGTVQVDDLRLTTVVEEDTDPADTDPADDTDPAGDTDTTADTGCGCANAPSPAPFAAWIAVILAFSAAARRSGCSRA